jgi:predicted 2-oxoglutarate/Fe(II)-dependent dioxygenase YbiX
MSSLEQFGKIHYYKNVIQDPEYLINLIESSDQQLTENTSIPKWQEWSASGDIAYHFGYQKRFSKDVDLDKTPDIRRINNILKDAILGASEDYAKVYGIDIGNLMPLSISKYSTSKSMGPHVDDYGDGENPNISVVLYLNDNYKGGEIYFKEQDVKIKPEAGSIVIFPSVEPYYHESLPVLEGIKYMCPGFWRKTNKVV